MLRRKSPNPEDLPCELVAGETCIQEEMLGLKFRISPHSFFQVSKRKKLDDLEVVLRPGEAALQEELFRRC